MDSSQLTKHKTGNDITIENRLNGEQIPTDGQSSNIPSTSLKTTVNNGSKKKKWFADVPIIQTNDIGSQDNDSKRKKYKCSMCAVCCSNKGQLRGHIRTHTGERPFACPFQGCTRQFARNEELTRHAKIHSGLRPHKCVTCDKAFGRKDHLTKHEKTHWKREKNKTDKSSRTKPTKERTQERVIC